MARRVNLRQRAAAQRGEHIADPFEPESDDFAVNSIAGDAILGEDWEPPKREVFLVDEARGLGFFIEYRPYAGESGVVGPTVGGSQGLWGYVEEKRRLPASAWHCLQQHVHDPLIHEYLEAAYALHELIQRAWQEGQEEVRRSRALGREAPYRRFVRSQEEKDLLEALELLAAAITEKCKREWI
jgi:hypothetical protein